MWEKNIHFRVRAKETINLSLHRLSSVWQGRLCPIFFHLLLHYSPPTAGESLYVQAEHRELPGGSDVPIHLIILRQLSC